VRLTTDSFWSKPHHFLVKRPTVVVSDEEKGCKNAGIPSTSAGLLRFKPRTVALEVSLLDGNSITFSDRPYFCLLVQSK
jgi:hypothetical protein